MRSPLTAKFRNLGIAGRGEKSSKKSGNLRESRFRDLLHSNYAPTDSELVEIRALCNNSLKVIEKTKLEVQRLQTLLQLTEQKRDELESLYNSHAALLSPFRRISVELLQLIFSFCLPNHRNPVMSAEDAPLLLTRICGRWRDVALNTPELWSSIHVVVPGVDDGVHASLRLQALKVWLSRSGACLLNISLYIQLPERKRTVLSFVKQVISLAHRWAHITLVSPVEYMHQLDILSSFDHPSLKGLRSFELTTAFHRPGGSYNFITPYQYVPSGTILPQPLHFLGRAPNLRTLLLGLNTEFLLEFLPRFNTASNLEELVLDYPHMFHKSPIEFIRLLSHCHKLRKLEIWGYHPDGQFLLPYDSESPSLVTLQFLESFTGTVARAYGSEMWSAGTLHLLDHLITPSLKELRLSCIEGRLTTAIAETLTRLFLRSAPCPLEALDLFTEAGYNISYGMIASALHHVPCLKSLSINMPRHTAPFPYYHPLDEATNPVETPTQEPDLLNALTLSTDDIFCCPNLEEVTLKWCELDSRYDSLISFLKSRTGSKVPSGCVPLKVLTAEWPNRPTPPGRYGAAWNGSDHDSGSEEGRDEERGDAHPSGSMGMPLPSDIRLALDDIEKQAPNFKLVIPSQPVLTTQKPNRSPWYGVRTDDGDTLE